MYHNVSASRMVTCMKPSSDGAGDHVGSLSSENTAFKGNVVDILNSGARAATLAADAVQALFGNTAYPCDEAGPEQRVVCAESAKRLPMPAGEVLTFFMQVAAPIPQNDMARSYIYSVVLDSDGAAANNWQFVPPYDWDYFQGTDRWHQLIWDHRAAGGGTWKLTATQVNDQQQTAQVSTTARAVISGDAIVFHIAASEFSAPAGYRMSAFAHDGNFSQSSRGGDVTAANPTEALTPMP
jgi:hypothetical protein